MSMTKRQKYAELRKSTTLKESHSNEPIKFATITLTYSNMHYFLVGLFEHLNF